MIVETMLDNGLVRHYSDQGMLMLQVETGVTYGDAIDAVPCRYTYEETDEPAEDQSAETVATLDYVVGRVTEMEASQAASDDALAELAEMAATNEADIESVSQAVVELAEMVGGGE